MLYYANGNAKLHIPFYLCYNSSMIIDFHTHIFPSQIKNNREKYVDRDPLFRLLYSSPKAKLASADDLIASMDENAIDISIVLNIAWNSQELCRETNDYILDSVSRFPHRLVGFCMVLLDSPEAAFKEIEHCAKNGIRGIGETRPGRVLLNNLTQLDPIFRKIIENNLILLTHASEPLGHIYTGKGDITPEALFPLIARFPELKMVCAHWGGGLPFYALMPEVKQSLDNVYFDSAASPYLYSAGVYNRVKDLVGSEKILFGTDYPLISPKRLLNEIETLNLSSTVNNQILGENARKLLRI